MEDEAARRELQEGDGSSEEPNNFYSCVMFDAADISRVRCGAARCSLGRTPVPQVFACDSFVEDHPNQTK